MEFSGGEDTISTSWAVRDMGSVDFWMWHLHLGHPWSIQRLCWRLFYQWRVEKYLVGSVCWQQVKRTTRENALVAFSVYSTCFEIQFRKDIDS